ncbi:MarR family winged helix-turn-helix transcriptional regulator [Nisaea sediminum]|uniref:MarR family winged helix-turn-helix transcriptional regulator n=1 Tax=Nisaea sediminum TaxID=2775867 RepID=UPI0018674557|nr:helix-turn-helix domain-containing protein [Nisaea sediminum]
MKTSGTALTGAHQTAWVRLVRASERILQRVESALKSDGLPPLAWYDLLLEVKRAEPDGLRPYQLQSRMLIPQYNMSRLVDRMAKAGVIERRTCAEDGRGQVICLTDDGLALQQRMWPVYRSVLEREVGGRMDEAGALELAALLAPLAEDG